MIHSESSQRGFVLLLTLILLMIAAVMMTAVARKSMTTALDARIATEDLQRRWGATSLSAVLLPRAEQLLSQAEKEDGESVARLTKRCRLGDMDFELTIADEQAKVNLNMLLATRSRLSVYEAIDEISADSDGSGGVEIKSLALLDKDKQQGQSIRSFGQVFESDSPQTIQAAARSLTCWGDGRLQWRRTPAEALRKALDPLIDHTAIENLIGRREADDTSDVRQAIANLQGVSNKHRLALEHLLTDDSTCHSLWITIDDPHRRWNRLIIAEQMENQPAKSQTTYWHFEW